MQRTSTSLFCHSPFLVYNRALRSSRARYKLPLTFQLSSFPNPTSLEQAATSVFKVVVDFTRYSRQPKTPGELTMRPHESLFYFVHVVNNVKRTTVARCTPSNTVPSFVVLNHPIVQCPLLYLRLDTRRSSTWTKLTMRMNKSWKTFVGHQVGACLSERNRTG
jgi:hypothetical protein